MRTYKLYSATVSSNAACNITIQRSGRIKSVRWSICLVDKTDGHYQFVELSTAPVSQMSTHDTLNSIDEVRSMINIGAAGADSSQINDQKLLDYPIAAGERLYLNTAGTSAASYITCFVDVQD